MVDSTLQFEYCMSFFLLIYLSVSFLFISRRNCEQHFTSRNSKMVRTWMEIFDGELLGFWSSREALILRNLSKAEKYGWCPGYEMMLDLQPVCLPTLWNSDYWAHKWDKNLRFCILQSPNDSVYIQANNARLCLHSWMELL